MIQFITEMVGWTYDIRADGGNFQIRRYFKGRPLEIEFYEVPQATINRMTGGTGGGMGGPAADPLLRLQREEEEAGDDTGIKIKAFGGAGSCLMMQKVINLFLMASNDRHPRSPIL